MFRRACPITMLLLAACAGSSATPGPATGDRRDAPAVEVRAALPPGTVLRLRPAEVVVSGAAIDRAFTDALLREALRLSPHFDVAADLEDVPAPTELVPTIDAAAGRIAIALRRPDQATLPLASAAIGADSIPAAIDELAWAVRRALGEAVAAPPASVAAIYSASPTCVRATERAQAFDLPGADATRETLLRALEADPGCTVARNALAAWQLARGDADTAEQTAEQTLQLLEARLSPTTQHRLARVLLLARARTGAPRAVRTADEQLFALGEALLRERPFDPHGRYSRALGANFLGRFELAAADLEILLARWPEVPWVPYQLAFARLGLGDAEGALAAIEQAARRLPMETTLLAHALALYGAGEQEELAELLERAVAHDPPGSSFRHEALRMQAAHAILTGRREDAVRALLEDLDWLHQRPSVLDLRAAELAELGEVVVRLGAGDALPARLTALRENDLAGQTLSLALAFIEGLSAAQRGDEDLARVAVGTLERADETAWAARVRAELAHSNGDVATEARELAEAVSRDDGPLVRAAFVRTLRAIGRHDDAEKLLDAMRERFERIDLRQPLDHPLLSPGGALASLATRPSGH